MFGARKRDAALMEALSLAIEAEGSLTDAQLGALDLAAAHARPDALAALVAESYVIRTADGYASAYPFRAVVDFEARNVPQLWA
jgi:hypothetical protein